MKVLKHQQYTLFLKILTTRVGTHGFIVHSHEYGIMRKPGTGRPSKLYSEIKRFVKRTMRKDDETTAHQLYIFLEILA